MLHADGVDLLFNLQVSQTVKGAGRLISAQDIPSRDK